jgi:hypothetical protein
MCDQIASGHNEFTMFQSGEIVILLPDEQGADGMASTSHPPLQK